MSTVVLYDSWQTSGVNCLKHLIEFDVPSPLCGMMNFVQLVSNACGPAT